MTALDALICLNASVGIDVPLDCVACIGATTTLPPTTTTTMPPTTTTTMPPTTTTMIPPTTTTTTIPPGEFRMTVEVIGDGAGTITSTPDGITDCATECFADFDADADVDLDNEPGGCSASAGVGKSRFIGCCEDPSGSGTCSSPDEDDCMDITMDQDRTILAQFDDECPAPGLEEDGGQPLDDLTKECDDTGFIYTLSLIAEAFATTGTDVTLVQSDGTNDLQYTGTVVSGSTTTFSLVDVSINGGTAVAIGASSGGVIRNGGGILDVVIDSGGDTFDFSGADYRATSCIDPSTLSQSASSALRESGGANLSARRHEEAGFALRFRELVDRLER